MNPLAKYTGLAYDFMRRNCWHHVREVRADAGLETPEFDCASPRDEQCVFESAHDDSKGMVQSFAPRDFDAVLMATARGGRLLWHSGVYCDGMVSHCDRFAKQVKLEPFADIAKRYQRVEFWR